MERESCACFHIITITITIIIIIIIIIQTLLILTHFNPTVTNILLLILGEFYGAVQKVAAWVKLLSWPMKYLVKFHIRFIWCSQLPYTSLSIIFANKSQQHNFNIVLIIIIHILIPK
jgi:hypothetical protein